MKKHASDKTVRAFCEAVYLDSTDLAMTMNGEEEILAEATRLIIGLKAELAGAREHIRELERGRERLLSYVDGNDKDAEYDYQHRHRSVPCELLSVPCELLSGFSLLSVSRRRR